MLKEDRIIKIKVHGKLCYKYPCTPSSAMATIESYSSFRQTKNGDKYLVGVETHLLQLSYERDKHDIGRTTNDHKGE